MRTHLLAVAITIFITVAIFFIPIGFSPDTYEVRESEPCNVMKFNIVKYNIVKQEYSDKVQRKIRRQPKKQSQKNDNRVEKVEISSVTEQTPTEATNEVLKTSVEEAKDMSFAEVVPKTDMSFADCDGENVLITNDNTKTLTGAKHSKSKRPMTYKPNFTIDKRPIYPATARRMGQQGRVGLTVCVDECGKVISIVATPSSGYDLLDNAAISAVKQWKFSNLDLPNKINIITTEVIFELN